MVIEMFQTIGDNTAMNNNSNQLRREVVVVGGGPAGAIAAAKAARKGSETLLLDKKESLDSSSACAGLISASTLKRLEIGEEVILNRIRGAFIYPPDGESFKLEAEEPRGYVLDRDRLNGELINRARGQGVEIREKERVVLGERGDLWTKNLDSGRKRPLYASVLIGADGPSGTVGTYAGLEKPQKLLHSVQYRGPCQFRKKSFVEVYFGREIAPGFFGWVVPTGEQVARVGLATARKGDLQRYLRKLLRMKGITRPEKRGELSAGPIPLGPLQPAVEPEKGVMLTGDAAAQVKPTTGGGLYPISICAEIAGDEAARAKEVGPERACLNYEKEWQTQVGAELSKEMYLHQLLNRIGDSRLNGILHSLDRPRLLRRLSKEGHIDHIYPLAKRLLGERGGVRELWATLPRKLVSILKGSIFGL